MEKAGQGFQGSNGFLLLLHVKIGHVVGTMEQAGIVTVDGYNYYLDDKTFFVNEPVHLFFANRIYQADSSYREYLKELNKK